MWAIPTCISSVLFFKKKKKNQVRSPSPESRVPKTGSDPPFGSDRESGCDMEAIIPTEISMPTIWTGMPHQENAKLVIKDLDTINEL